MGAWDPGSFDNDDAMDWLGDLADSADTGPIFVALATITGAVASEHVEAPECSQAIAAAEIVAAMKGAPAARLPNEVQDWLKRHQQPATPMLAQLALEAVARIKAGSELKALWAESAQLAQWEAAVTDLEQRLGVKRTGG